VSVPALSVVSEAAIQCGDPQYQTIALDEWLVYLNASTRDLARKLLLKRRKTVGDITADMEYAYPANLIQVIRVEWNPTPSDATTWRKLREVFEDEFEDKTTYNYPTGDPLGYFASTESFFLLPMPQQDLSSGLRITYWGVPDAVTSISTQPITIMDMLRDALRERMVIYGMRRQQRYDEATAHEKEWEAALQYERPRLEDRSADRRSAVRPAKLLNNSLRAR